eukprot:1849166-Rhodomonas_salina.2
MEGGAGRGRERQEQDSLAARVARATALPLLHSPCSRQPLLLSQSTCPRQTRGAKGEGLT